MRLTNKQLFESIGFFDTLISPEKGKKDYFHASKTVNLKKRLYQDRIHYGNVYLFISREMYPNTKRNYVYAILYQKNEFTPFRCRTTYVLEGNKQFFSAKTQRELILQIKRTANFDKFVIL